MEYSVLLYYAQNGTLHVFEEEPAPPIASAVIILICFLFGVVYNFLVTAAVLSNKKLRTRNLHLIILQVTIICFLDSLTVESVAFGFLFSPHQEWCLFSAGAFQLFLLLHSLTVSFLCVEQTLCLHKIVLTVRSCWFGFLGSWLIGLLFTIPTLVLSGISFYAGRNSCCLVTSVIWLQIWFLVGFLSCWIVVFICLISSFRIMKINLKEKNELTVLSVFPVTNGRHSKSVFPTFLSSANKIVFSVIFFYFILILPHTLSVTVTYFLELNFVPDPWLDPKSSVDNLNRFVFTSELDSLFIYFRYIYNVVIPIVILASDRDLRQSCRYLFSCRKNVVSDQGSNVQDKFSEIQISDSPVTDMKIPVLFATSSGIYLRYPSQTNNLNVSHVGSMSSSRANFRLMSILCDSNTKSDMEPSLYFVKRPELILNEAGGKRNVRFSSKVQAISPLLNTTEMSHFSDTRVVQNPIFVKADINDDHDGGRTN